MRRDLTDLLAERGVAHPTRIVRATLAGGDLQVEVAGWRWWEEAGGHDGRVTLVFAGLTGGRLDAALLAGDGDDEALEIFDVRPLADEPWAMAGPVHSTYCQQPLADPMALHAIVHDFLVRHRAPRGPFEYLNGGPTLAGFRRLTGDGSFLVSRAPAAMQALVAEEVERQGVRHNVLVDPYPASTDLIVRLGDAGFICTDAWAEWDEASPC